jgi:hypothetical protein
MATPPARAAGQTASDAFIFRTADLYERNGFESGDMLAPAFAHLCAADVRSLLVQVLAEHVIPKLSPHVQTLTVPSAHNPVRAVSVGGKSVGWTTPHSGRGPEIRPATVSVGLDAILATARRLRVAEAAV